MSDCITREDLLAACSEVYKSPSYETDTETGELYLSRDYKDAADTLCEFGWIFLASESEELSDCATLLTQSANGFRVLCHMATMLRLHGSQLTVEEQHALLSLLGAVWGKVPGVHEIIKAALHASPRNRPGNPRAM
jgi:hypothetical protein